MHLDFIGKVITKGRDDIMHINESILVSMVKDLEDTRHKYCGYAYRRTIRNILIGNKDAAIAPHFKDKPYYGIARYLSLDSVDIIMDYLVEKRLLCVLYKDRGKLYCTPAYHRDACMRH